MDNKLSAVVLALVSSVCFISGVLILSSEEEGVNETWIESNQ